MTRVNPTRRTLAVAALIGALVGACASLTIPSCASAPPAGLYTAPQTRIYNTENAEQTVIALSQTAINLNGQGHLSDADTRLVRDFALAFDAWRASYANGAATTAQVQASLTTLTNSLSTDATSTTLKASLALVLAAVTAIQ